MLSLLAYLIPARELTEYWVPAFAGMTAECGKRAVTRTVLWTNLALKS